MGKIVKDKIPPAVITRLSIYYRVILESRKKFLSSDEISKLTDFSSAQVRRDLTYFGQFGIPGKGYNTDLLKASILNILGLDRKWNVALVGVGNLGSALLSYKGFSRQGFKISCAFDADPAKVGTKVNSVLIRDIKELSRAVRKNNIHIAILAVPKDVAQGVTDTLAGAGIRAILNFAPVRPKPAKPVTILNIDLSIELERLAYFLARKT
jgi:redox-sensing transcriptional repressor